MNTLSLFSFIKNEVDIIESFLEHHLNIFDEITIIDNGSIDGTLDILKKYDIKLIHNHSTFDLKGEICTDIMKKSKCDILVPIDADEKMIYDKDVKTKNKNQIRSYLQNLKIDGNKYKIKRIYEYHPDNDGWYDLEPHQKVIFPRQSFIYTDGGFHRGRTTLDDPNTFDHEFYWRNRYLVNDKYIPINISYLHYHFRSREIWLKNTEMKLKERLGKDYLSNLESYNGSSVHLKYQYLRYIQTGKWHILKKRFYIDESKL